MMYITNFLTNFLNLSVRLSDSTILLTNLEEIIFVASHNDDSYYKNIYLNNTISLSLKKILNLYTCDNFAINYMNTTMESIVELIINDNILRYKSQIILPIIHDDIEGLLIFFTNNREYISSNLNFAKTTKHFIELFSTNEYL